MQDAFVLSQYSVNSESGNFAPTYVKTFRFVEMLHVLAVATVSTWTAVRDGYSPTAKQPTKEEIKLSLFRC